MGEQGVLDKMEVRIPFNTLKPGYEKHRDEYIKAATRVLDSGWYVLEMKLRCLRKNFPPGWGSITALA